MVAVDSATPWRVLVTRRVASEAMDLLRASDAKLDLDIWDSDDPMPHAELLTRLATGYDALYCMLTDKINGEVLATAGERLKVVSTMSVGFNHIDVAECKKRGILIGHTPGVLTDTVADTCVGLMLAACRRFKEATASVWEGTWGTWTPNGMCGPDVAGSSVGIIGFGRIGIAVARRMKGFGCELVYTDVMGERKDIGAELGARFVPNVDELLGQVDIVVPLCPLNDETQGMFNWDLFSKMKKGSVFVNCARGELVVQEDLYRALTEGVIFAAGLDVTVPEPLPKDDPLVGLPNCFILPHIASASIPTRREMGLLASKNLLAAYEGTKLPCEV